MVTINIRDKNFGGEPSSCHKGVNKQVKWEFGNTPVSKSCFITDLCLPDVFKASGVKRKIAWILEPRAIHPQVYDWIEKNNKLFDYVLTFDLDLVDRGENFLYYPHGRCWINGKSKDITPMNDQFKWGMTLFGPLKDRNCSIIASTKNFTEGHQLRHKVIQSNLPDLDVYGYGYKPVDNKRDALDRYRFSVTIENSIQRGYWTEKVVDCFATMTVPIFWGDKEGLSTHFNKDGILFADNLQDIKILVDQVSKDGEAMWEKMANAIHENYHKVEQYRIPEDWIYTAYPFLFN